MTFEFQILKNFQGSREGGSGESYSYPVHHHRHHHKRRNLQHRGLPMKSRNYSTVAGLID
jgi:hypothetical protein